MNRSPYLERCTDCDQVQYPPRGFCGRCLSAHVNDQSIGEAGELLSWATLRTSLEPAIAEHLPLTIASVKLDEGPVVIAYFNGQPRRAGQPVKISSGNGPAGDQVLVARSADDSKLPDIFLTPR